MNQQRFQPVIEKHYTAKELCYLVGFDRKWWYAWAKTDDAILRTPTGEVIAQPREIAGEIFVPASCINAYLARHPYRYDAGIAARNTAELRRKLKEGK